MYSWNATVSVTVTAVDPKNGTATADLGSAKGVVLAAGVAQDVDTNGDGMADFWQFAGYPQLPSGTLTVNPDGFSGIVASSNLTNGPWTDLTYNLNSIDDGIGNTILHI